MDENGAGDVVMNCAFAVHKELGPGLLESVYERALFGTREALDNLRELRASVRDILYDNEIQGVIGR